MSDSASEFIDSPPIPPRYRWLKRIAAVLVIHAVLVLGLRLWLGWEAQRRLDAKIAELRAAGEPVLAEDFAAPPIPDSENAAVLLQQAAAAFVDTLTATSYPVDPSQQDEQVAISLLVSDPATILAYLSQVRDLVSANDTALRLIAQSREREQADWGVMFATPAINVLLPHLAGQRNLAKLLNVAAIHAHITGEHAVAVSHLQDGLMLAERLAQGPAITITRLVEVALAALAANTVEIIAPTLEIRPSAEGASPVTPTSRDAVMRVVKILLDDQRRIAAIRRAAQGERAMSLDTVLWIVSGSGSPGRMLSGAQSIEDLAPVRFAMRPFWLVEVRRGLGFWGDWKSAFESLNWPVAAKLLPQEDEIASASMDPPGLSLMPMLFPPIHRAVLLECRGLALSRMAALALAIRLYELDHGRRPACLTELVPDYLPVLPTDPFSEDHRAFGYAPDAERPVIYSIGPDGVDGGGKYLLGETGAVSMDLADLVFFLDGKRPQGRKP